MLLEGQLEEYNYEVCKQVTAVEAPINVFKNHIWILEGEEDSYNLSLAY